MKLACLIVTGMLISLNSEGETICAGELPAASMHGNLDQEFSPCCWRRRQRVTPACFQNTPPANSAATADSYTISGRIQLETQPPPPAAFLNPMFIARLGLRDQSLLVDPKTLGLKNAYVIAEFATPQPTAPPATGTSGGKHVLQADVLGFSPRCIAARVGEPLVLENRMANRELVLDLNFLSNRRQLISIPPLASQSLILENPERAPVRIASTNCPWMEGYVSLTTHPLVAITDAEGRFSLGPCPAAPVRLIIWHERKGILKSPKLTQDLRQVTKKRHFEVDLTSGSVDLGTIIVANNEVVY